MLGRNGVIGAGAALDGQLRSTRPSAKPRARERDRRLRAETARQGKRDDPHCIGAAGHVLAAQTQQVAACNALHELEERLSRWLLQSRDLLSSDTLPLTQEFLAQMLGVQRSSVTLVARKLQEAGLINYRRGRIHVLDVEGLQDSCCECYGAINAHFRPVIGWSPGLDPQSARDAKP